MRTITTTTDIYTYDELGDSAKEYALKHFRDNNTYDTLSDDLDYKARELLEERGYKIVTLKVYYSLSHSQGDGVCFDGTFLINKKQITIKQSGRYSHEYANNFMFYDEETGDVLAEDKAIIGELRGLMQETARYGYECMDYEDSEEYFRDFCNNYDLEFLKDGTRYTGVKP